MIGQFANSGTVGVFSNKGFTELKKLAEEKKEEEKKIEEEVIAER